MQKWISPRRIRAGIPALLLAAELHDRGRHRVDGEHRHRGAGPHRLVEEDELLDRAAALAAVLVGPADAEPAVGAHLPDHPAHDRPDALAVTQLAARVVVEQVVVVVAELLAELLLVFGVGHVHVVPSRVAFRRER